MTTEGLPDLIPPDGALVALVRADGALLLQHRDDFPTIVYPGRWGIPGGAVEPGETAIEAALREVEEETGYRLTAAELRPITIQPDERDGKPMHRHSFWAAYDGVQPITCLEGQEMRWLFFAETHELCFCPGHREALILLDGILGARFAAD